MSILREFRRWLHRDCDERLKASRSINGQMRESLNEALSERNDAVSHAQSLSSKVHSANCRNIGLERELMNTRVRLDETRTELNKERVLRTQAIEEMKAADCKRTDCICRIEDE